METDGERWTMFQRRQDGSVDFYPNWTDCQKGFDNLIRESWLGFGKVNCLTNISSPNTLQVDLKCFD